MIDRAENIRRVGEVAKLFADGGIVSLASFISPYQADRDSVRKLHEEAGLPFYEVYVSTPLSVCEERDPKGLYKKARRGEIKGFTGIDGAYEPPEKPDLSVGSKGESVEACVAAVLDMLEKNRILPPRLPDLVDLHVPASELEAKKAEAASLPHLTIDKMTLEWLQVRYSQTWATLPKSSLDSGLLCFTHPLP